MIERSKTMRLTTAIGFFLATSALMAATPQLPPPDTTLRGVVTSVKGNTITLLKGMNVDVSAANVTHRGNAAAASDLVPGMRVRVVIASTKPSGTLVAGKVYIEAPDATIVGPIDSVTSGSITVAGQTFSTDATTTYGGFANGTPIRTAADLKSGMPVAVDILLSANGLAAGRVIAVGPPPPPPAMPEPSHTTLTGGITSIAPAQWTVGTTTVYIAPKTLISGSPAVGDTVTVDGIPTTEGAIIASAIRKQ
jgi:hypothetical protein